MKKSLLGFFALVLGTLVLVSCKKEDDSKLEKNDRYLTLEQQQVIFSQAVSQVAQNIDFSGLQPAYDVISANAGKQFDFTSLVLGVISDSIITEGLQEFVNGLASDTLAPDFSKVRFSIDFATKDTVITKRHYDYDIDDYVYDTISQIKPYPVKVNYKNDCSQLNINLDGHVFSIKVKAADNTSRVVAKLEDETGKGESMTALYLLPKNLNLSIDFDNKPLAALSLGLDADAEFTKKVLPGENHYMLDAKKFDISIKGEIAELSMEGNASFNIQKGLSVKFNTSLDGTQLINGSIALNADLTDLAKDASESTVMAWALDYDKLRNIEFNASLMGNKVIFKSRLDNPAKDSKALASLTEIAQAEKVTPDMADRFIERISPFFSSDVYYAGFDKPQASVELVATSEMNLNDLMGKVKEGEGGILSNLIAGSSEAIGAAASKFGTCIVPSIRIHAAKAEDEKVVSVHEFMEKVDVESAANTVMEKFSKAFRDCAEILGTFFGEVFN